jgi:hypothetical protein
MSEHFDPRRHRVWAVDVTHTYRTYVVAESAEEADAAAAAHTDADLGVETARRVTRQLTLPLPESDDAVAWGPVRWGRRWLRVNELLRLLEKPRPAPPVVPTDQLRLLGGWDWVRLAAAVDSSRPVLRAIQVRDGRAVATDRRRLHTAPVCCPDGLWDPELMEPVAGDYPTCEAALDIDGPLMELHDLPAVWELLRVARPGTVELPCGLGRCTLDADQLAEALLGAATAERILLAAAAGDTAIRLDFPDLGRTAVLGRLAGRHPSADLSLFVRPLELAGSGR